MTKTPEVESFPTDLVPLCQFKTSQAPEIDWYLYLRHSMNSVTIVNWTSSLGSQFSLIEIWWDMQENCWQMKTFPEVQKLSFAAQNDFYTAIIKMDISSWLTTIKEKYLITQS